MAKLLTTKDMAARLGVHCRRLSGWKRRGVPHAPRHFPPTGRNGSGPWGTGWNPDKVIPWLKEEGQMDEAGTMISRRPGPKTHQTKRKAATRAATRAKAVAATAKEAGVLTSSAMAALLSVRTGVLAVWRKQGAPCLPKFFPPPGAQGGGAWGNGWKPDKLRAWLKKTKRIDAAGNIISTYTGKALTTPEQTVAKKKVKDAGAATKDRNTLLTTQEMAAQLGVTTSRLHWWANKCGAPHIKRHFPPTRLPGAVSSGGQWGTAWYPDKMIAWLKKEGRMGEDGKLREPTQGRKAHEGPDWIGPETDGGDWPILAARIVPLSLPHLLGAFAHACKGGGIPVGLQNKLANVGLEELDPKALKMIEEMALKHPRTEAQWILIKQSLPAFLGKKRRTGLKGTTDG